MPQFLGIQEEFMEAHTSDHNITTYYWFCSILHLLLGLACYRLIKPFATSQAETYLVLAIAVVGLVGFVYTKLLSHEIKSDPMVTSKLNLKKFKQAVGATVTLYLALTALWFAYSSHAYMFWHSDLSLKLVMGLMTLGLGLSAIGIEIMLSKD